MKQHYKIKLLAIAVVLLTAGACSNDEGDSASTGKQPLAYGGLELVVKTAEAPPAPGRLATLTAPLLLDNGIAITKVGIVMADVRLNLRHGKEIRWEHGDGQNHWGETACEGDGDCIADGSVDKSENEDGSANQDEVENDEGDGAAEGNSKDDLENANNKTKLDGPYYVDLLDGLAYPEFETAAIPAGVYNTVMFRLGTINEDADLAQFSLTSTSPVVGYSLIIEGTIDDDGLDVPFRLLFAEDNNKTYKLDLPDGLDIQPDRVNTIVLEFNAGLWVENLDLPGLFQAGDVPTDTDGALLFELTNDDLRDAFRYSFKNSLQIGNDGDGDKNLDEGESQLCEVSD